MFLCTGTRSTGPCFISLGEQTSKVLSLWTTYVPVLFWSYHWNIKLISIRSLWQCRTQSCFVTCSGTMAIQREVVDKEGHRWSIVWTYCIIWPRWASCHIFKRPKFMKISIRLWSQKQQFYVLFVCCLPGTKWCKSLRTRWNWKHGQIGAYSSKLNYNI